MPGQLRLVAARSLLVVAAILLSRFVLPATDEPAQAAMTTVIYGCFTLLALLLFRPQDDTSVSRTLGWCLTVTLLFTAVLLIDPLTRHVLIAFPGMVMTILLLASTVGIVAQRMPVAVAVAALALLTLSPIWAAPAIELAGNPTGLTDAVVASSPLTIVATAVDLDYLRTSWFYANSALGSMRYAYPDWVMACLFLSLVPLAAIVASVLRSTDFILFRLAKEAHP